MAATSTVKMEVSRTFATIREMLRARGHADLKDVDEVNPREVEALAETATIFHWDFDSCKTRVVYNLLPTFKTADINSKLTEDPAWQNIVVARSKPAQGKSIDTADRRVQLFLVKELLINISTHVNIPPHIPIRDEKEIVQIMEQYRLKARTQFPLIQFADPMARFLALHPNELVRIERPSVSEGTSVIYRCCQ